jgi:two-component system, cell cycle sensor histidine kinase and response regulator CckA
MALPDLQKSLDQRYQRLVELAPDGIVTHDGGQITLANAAAVRLAGATDRSELVGHSIEAFLEPPYLKAAQLQLVDSAVPAEPALPVRDTFRRVDGSKIQVEVRAVAFLDEGRPSAHLVIRNITERLAAEQASQLMQERLQQAQKLESVGALAGGVAHEVNNMMQVVLGFSDFLLQDPRVPAERLADVREITRAAGRAATVTRELLAFSRRAVHRPKVVDLAAAIRENEPAVRRLLGEERRLVIAADKSPRVWVDPHQLQQVIINLALNARDAMPPGGTLTLTTTETELPRMIGGDGRLIPAGHYATLLAHDTGAGIPVAIQSRIFEPFFTTKAVGKGTGLGLAATHGMLTQNHGYITVTSAPGEGTTFGVYLSALPPTTLIERPSQPFLQRSAAANGATLLVVDDEAAVRAVTARILERSGFRVIQASSGAAALEQIERHGPPTLVVTDLMMQGMGGAEVARRLKARWPSLPVLFMSGYSSDELIRQGTIGSDRELIQKPFTHQSLLASVTLALGSLPEEAAESEDSGRPASGERPAAADERAVEFASLSKLF